MATVFLVSIFTAAQNSFDYGSTIGSYFGLLFLIGAYTSIGVFTSTLSDNQIVAFIVAVFICFMFYFGFEGIAGFFTSFSLLDKLKSITVLGVFKLVKTYLKVSLSKLGLLPDCAI